jgi:hypothetical protein
MPAVMAHIHKRCGANTNPIGAIEDGDCEIALSRRRSMVSLTCDAWPHSGEIDLGVLTTGGGVVHQPTLIPIGTWLQRHK